MNGIYIRYDPLHTTTKLYDMCRFDAACNETDSCMPAFTTSTWHSQRAAEHPCVHDHGSSTGTVHAIVVVCSARTTADLSYLASLIP
jgi:hypothetical protein